MQEFKIIAFTHKNLELDQVGIFHLNDDVQQQVLTELKAKLNLKELMYLSTCNRVEFLFTNDEVVTRQFVQQLAQTISPEKGLDLASSAQLYVGCLLYTSPSPRDRTRSRMPSSA